MKARAFTPGDVGRLNLNFSAEDAILAAAPLVKSKPQKMLGRVVNSLLKPLIWMFFVMTLKKQIILVFFTKYIYSLKTSSAFNLLWTIKDHE